MTARVHVIRTSYMDFLRLIDCVVFVDEYRVSRLNGICSYGCGLPFRGITAIRMKSISTLCRMLSFVIPPVHQCLIFVSFCNTCVWDEDDPLP